VRDKLLESKLQRESTERDSSKIGSLEIIESRNRTREVGRDGEETVLRQGGIEERAMDGGRRPEARLLHQRSWPRLLAGCSKACR
jgi:hypothetical protein